MLFVPHATHGWCHWSFQVSSCVLDNFWILFVIRIDKVNPSQLSSIVELLVLFCTFLLFSILSGFTNFRPNFWAYMIWSGSRLISLSISPRTTNILSEVSFLVEWISWILSKSLTNACLNRHSSNRQFLFLKYIQISISRPSYINVLQWNWECFLLRHRVVLVVQMWWRQMRSPWIDRKTPRALASSVDCVGWDSSDSTWISPLRSSLLTSCSRLRVGSRNS